MKKAIFFAAFMLIAFCGFSQGPSYPINYQAVVRNASGTLVPNGSTVNFRFSILEGSASGTVLYSETQSTVVNNSQGLVNLAIGEGVATVGTLLWSANFRDITKDKYLQVEMDPSGGSSFTNLGTSKLQGVPFANNALTANYALNGYWSKYSSTSSDIYYDAGNVNIGTATPTGTASLNVEKSTSANHVVSVIQTGTTGGSFMSAIKGMNNATGTTGIGVTGEQAGNGWGVYGRASGTSGIGVLGSGSTGVLARSSVSNGVSINLDGFMKVSGTKTAFQTTALVAAATVIDVSYGGAASTDILILTPYSTGTSTTLPGYVLIWNTTSSKWQIWNASDDGVPSNFPVGTGFNVMVIKQ